MKPFEIISALPQWAGASPAEIVASPAFTMPCRIGGEQLSLRHAAVAPDEESSLAVKTAFGAEEHVILLARSRRFPDLDRIWDSRGDVPEALLLALVERECGDVFQMLENAVRSQMRLVGIGGAADGRRLAFELSDGSLVFSIDASETVLTAFGVLRNLDLSHESIRACTLESECEYAAFALGGEEVSALAPGDAILLPEIGGVSPRYVVDGRFSAGADGVLRFSGDGLFRVRAAEPGTMTLGELFDAAEKPFVPPSPAHGLQLRLVKDGRRIASGRLDRLADQFAFMVEAI